MSHAVLELTDTTLEEEIQGADLPVIVEFWAEWCPPCKAMAPVLEAIAADHDRRLRVFKINADEHPEVARRYDITSIPTVLVFDAGELRGRLIGAHSQPRLTNAIAALIS